MLQTMGRIRATLDKDFAGAMKILDQEVPAKVTDLNAAAEQVKTYCTGVANERTSFDRDQLRQYPPVCPMAGHRQCGVRGILTMVLVAFISGPVRRALEPLGPRSE